MNTVLQSGEYESVGGSTPLYSDCRIIAATNVDLSEAVQEGDFREDLYYRLKVISLTLPPLRDRPDDIPLLAEYFLQHFASRHQRAIKDLSPASMHLLVTYPWPGNVRELENTIERAVVLCKKDQVDSTDLPNELHTQSMITQSQEGHSQETSVESSMFSVPLGTPLQEVERRLIMKTLAFTGGDKRQTAHLLGVATRTIYRKLAHIEESP